ncbi:TPX2 (targeting protein for Xklp2) protein family [Rhynchospora pubera]|uniref:TPX2 (Targeting protein for Xklp2) protein family n=1 Tax=Rhynchospora pubera TaxID=906938 RepID=A0AAV8GN63_9POAL|nr:TPX2 (targeting protein for Xklp2) protein family [Rhynchospora pubera]
MASLNTFNRATSMYDGGNRIKRNSTGSSGRSWTKKPKITNPHPFMLKTEERGRMKEELFLEKTKEMLLEEERLRIPVAQGLPWTTDVPEYPYKPPIKESTEPLDLILHTDIRAIDRAEFDHQVAERINFIEEIKSERERQRKMEEEEEIRKLRKELVPKAQPMPSFDHPFVPKKSILPHTIPKEPKFNSKQ